MLVVVYCVLCAMLCGVCVPLCYSKYLRYDFTMVGPGRFEVGLRLKKVVDIKVLDRPMVFVLDELLALQEQGKVSVDVDDVTLNVNLLIHLLNKEFLSHK
jgi:hypothetical protein